MQNKIYSKNYTNCQQWNNCECAVLRKLAKSPIDCGVSAVDCSMCCKLDPKQNINKFTVCKTLQRIKLGGYFNSNKHAGLVTVAKCAIGPGTHLHNEIGIFSSTQCGCAHRVAIMNEWGPEKCIDNIELIMQWLHEASILSSIQFIFNKLEAIVKSSIDKSDKEYRYYDLLFILEL